MVYYTIFSLDLIDTRDPLELFINEDTNPALYAQIKARMKEILNEDFLDGLTSDGIEIKWGTWKEDMARISMEFPYVRFELEGQGESKTDWWFATFQGHERKYYKAVVVPPWDVEPTPLQL